MPDTKRNTSPDASSLVRLNKAVAQSGAASRRKADELIFAGRVSVDGQIVREPGRQVDPASQRICLDGRPLGQPEEHLYLALHKPIQTVTTASDPEGRTTVLDLLPEAWRERRVVPVGRLDYFSEGLLLLSSDGELVNRLTHPRYHLPKVYEVRLREEVGQAALATMRKGMTLAEGEKLAPVQAEVEALPDGSTLLRLTLKQGINRQIRRMCRDLGLTILSLKRVSQGPVRLGELPKGKARVLSEAEVTSLKRAVGLAED